MGVIWSCNARSKVPTGWICHIWSLYRYCEGNNRSMSTVVISTARPGRFLGLTVNNSKLEAGKSAWARRGIYSQNSEVAACRHPPCFTGRGELCFRDTSAPVPKYLDVSWYCVDCVMYMLVRHIWMLIDSSWGSKHDLENKHVIWFVHCCRLVYWTSRIQFRHFQCHITTLAKLFTHTCPCCQAV